MGEQVRLVFSGEVAEGQHPAVVRKRLQGILKLDDARMETLFSGQAVVIKKAVDREQAARFSAAFDQAGARLRIVPLAPAAAQSADQTGPPAPARESTGEPAGDLSMLPVGADVLREDERATPPSVDIDTDHLSVKGATFVVDDGPAEVPAQPNVDHISLAELGAALGDGSSAVVVEITADFDLAEPGADLTERDKSPPPPPPDTSHITLDDEDRS